jgi:hypothetical protein
VTRIRTLLAVHAILSLAALALAAPFAALGASVTGGRPDGDLAYWARGSEVAVDALVRLAPLAGAPLRLAFGVLCVWVLVAPLTTALLLDAHRRDQDTGISRLPEAARTLWGPFLAQRAVQVVALVLAAATGAACLHFANLASADWPSAAAQGLVSLAALLPALAIATLAGAATDLAHAMTARRPRAGDGLQPRRFGGATATWLLAARWALFHPVRALGPYALTVLAATLLTLVAAMLAEQLGGRPGLAALGLFAAQQAVALARTALRSAWLETALVLAAREPSSATLTGSPSAP